MKQYFIHKENHPHLTLFFAGWGMDEHPFQDYSPRESDLLICYDYRSLHFDFSVLEGYHSIRLIAWSFGVWAAAHALQHAPALPIAESIAVNGTLTPVHNTQGIPQAIFRGTLDGLNENTLHKFRRRICGGSEALKAFLKRSPQREVEELKEELRRMGEHVATLPVPAFEWRKAVIGKEDMIFPTANQRNAWLPTSTAWTEADIPHYSEELLRKLLCGSRNIE